MILIQFLAGATVTLSLIAIGWGIRDAEEPVGYGLFVILIGFLIYGLAWRFYMYPEDMLNSFKTGQYECHLAVCDNSIIHP
mgnify:CR=1 FL=1